MSDSTMLIRRKGICTNPDCDMCLSREVQEIEPGEDFVCAECGAPLKDAGKIPTPGGDTKKNKLIPIIIGVVAILLGGGAAWYFLSGNGQYSLVLCCGGLALHILSTRCAAISTYAPCGC